MCHSYQIFCFIELILTLGINLQTDTDLKFNNRNRTEGIKTNEVLELLIAQNVIMKYLIYFFLKLFTVANMSYKVINVEIIIQNL